MVAAITGWGAALPATEITSAELETRYGLPPGWIEERTGISARRVAEPEETTTALAIAAGQDALASAKLDASDIDLVMVATCTPDVALPPVAALVQAGLGAARAGAVDVGAACAGFLYALAQADALIRAGTVKRVLVCGAEIMSRSIQGSDPRTAVLFGDGAGAVVVEHSEAGSGIGPIRLASDGSRPDLLWADISDRTIRMKGRPVYLRAVAEMAGAVESLLADAGMGLGAVDLLIAHQANARILTAVADKLLMPEDRVFSNIARLGNTSAASIPLALHDAVAAGRLNDGDTVVLTAFGAGFLWGAAVVQWGAPVQRPLAGTAGEIHV
jgi:3-oxoacyl-[acyl-carrier-protein] synthase-3